MPSLIGRAHVAVFPFAVTTFTASLGPVTSIKLTTGLADAVNIGHSICPFLTPSA